MNQLSVEQSYKDAYMQRRERLGMAARSVQRVLVNRGTPEPKQIEARAEWQTEAFTVAVCEPSTTMPEVDPGVWKKNQVWVKIVREVCEDHGVTERELKARRRNSKIILARHEAFWRIREETSLTYPQIGERMGGFDHTTVIHGCTKHEKILAERAARAASFPEFMERKAK